MSMDSETLLHAGVTLAALDPWCGARRSLGGPTTSEDKVFTHQVGKAPPGVSCCSGWELREELDYPTVELLGNIRGLLASSGALGVGAGRHGHLAAVSCCWGSGSGLNSVMLGLQWGQVS